MNFNEFLFTYLLFGLAITVLIILFPQDYMESLGKALVTIKTFSLKRKHRDNNTPPPPIKPEQEKYIQELNDGAEQEMINTQKSTFHFNLNLLKVIFGWPLIMFLYFFALIIKIFNLDDPDLP